MNPDIRARLVSLAVQSEEKAKEYQAKAEDIRTRGVVLSGWTHAAVFWEGLAEQAEKRAARCREKLEGAELPGFTFGFDGADFDEPEWPGELP